jgi:tetratricopeptide (TPR) repeat protein
MFARFNLTTLAVLVATCPVSAAGPRSPLWPFVEDRVVHELCDRDVGEWAVELKQKPLTDDFEDLLLRFSVYLRAGHIEALGEIIDRFPEGEASAYTSASQRGYGEYNWLATKLIANRRFNLAQAFLEARPRTRCFDVRPLLDHLVERHGAKEADRFVHIYQRHYNDEFLRLRRHIYSRAGGRPKLVAILSEQIEAPHRLREQLAVIAEDRPQDPKLPITWIKRAEDLIGRKLFDEAEDEFQEALALAPIANEHSSRHPNRRADVIRHYSYFLSKHRGVMPMMEFLFAELSLSAPGSNYQFNVVQAMVTHVRVPGDEGTLQPDDERLWAFLDVRKQWSMIAKMLLGQMADNAAGDINVAERFWSRAESMAAEGDFTRAATLGRVMYIADEYRRPIPILKAVEQERAAAGHHTQVSLTLLQVYIALGDWTAADDIWKRAVRSIPRDNVPMLIGQVAVSAAERGEYDEAMKWWRRRTNFNRDGSRDIDKMLAAGMRGHLLNFYETLAKADAASDSPRHVINYIVKHAPRECQFDHSLKKPGRTRKFFKRRKR